MYFTFSSIAVLVIIAMLFPCANLFNVCNSRLFGQGIKDVSCNRERTYFAVLTKCEISVFLSKPAVKLVSLLRSETCVSSKGHNQTAVWKPDSSTLIILATGGFMLYYEVQFQERDLCYRVQDSGSGNRGHVSEDSLSHRSLPRVKLRLSMAVQLPCAASGLIPLRDEVAVFLKDGWIRRIGWNATVKDDFSFNIHSVPFVYDQLQYKNDYLDQSLFIISIAYSPLPGGFAIVLSDGRGGILMTPQLKGQQSNIYGLWAPDLKDGKCVAVNHKCQLINFGCASGEIRAYHNDEATGGLVVAQVKFELGLQDTVGQNCGAVKCLEWSPHGNCLACAFASGGLAVFSTFGAVVWSSFCDSSRIASNLLLVHTMDWSAEGYHLWLGCDLPTTDRHPNNSLPSTDDLDSVGLWVLPFVRSAALNNPCMVTDERIVLLSDDTVYLSPKLSSADASSMHMHWNVLKVSCGYLANNWPLRYCALDRLGQNIAVAGTHGIAHCVVNKHQQHKWRLFGNETQEHEMIVYGGLGWWRNFIVAPVFNVNTKEDEIRWYPKDCKLENMFATILTLENQVFLMNFRDDVLITLNMDMRVQLLGMVPDDANTYPSLRVNRICEIVLSEIVPHPACVIGMQLTSLSMDSQAAQFCPGADSLLVNISGKLSMLHPSSGQDDASRKKLNSPLPIASFVEQFWCFPQAESKKPHLAQALWIYCGSKGMNVWMPLFPQGTTSNQAFISKRHMLPYDIGIYPLAVNGSQCMATGIECLTRQFILNDSKRIFKFHLQRSSEVFLHQILRQLLKKNLGMVALQIAGSCGDLHFFSHVLELLLHSVLEEEATSRDPIPDPLLPRVCAFIETFPEYLEVVAHCARKTEIALWTHLFQIVGDPKELFEYCIAQSKLETASAYLIILQNMESGYSSREHAVLLLESALNQKEWQIAKEVMRLLKLIDPADIESPPRTPLMLKQLHTQQHRMSMGLSSVVNDKEALDSLIYQPPGIQVKRARQPSIASPRGQEPREGVMRGDSPTVDSIVSGSPKGDSFISVVQQLTSSSKQQQQKISPLNDVAKSSITKTSSDPKPKLSPHPLTLPTHGISKNSSKRLLSESSLGQISPNFTVEDYFDLILNEHARELLQVGRLYDLGCFSAHLDFHLVLWLTKERNRSAKVQNYISCLKQLHTDFSWPLPLLKQTVVDFLTTKVLVSPLRDSQSLKPLHVITRHGSQDSGFTSRDNVTQQNNTSRSKQIGAIDCATAGEQTLHNLTKTKRLLVAQQAQKAKHDQLKGPEDDGGQGIMQEAALVAASVNPNADLRSVIDTDTDSMFGSSAFTEDDTNGGTNGSSPLVDWDGIEQLCNEMTARGSGESEVQLRFFQQIMLEAGCVEWSLILCLALRDLVGLARAVNLMTVQRSPPDVMLRMKSGVMSLQHWAEDNCVGYKPLLQAGYNHLVSLESHDALRRRTRSLSESPKDDLPKPSVFQLLTESSDRRTDTRHNAGGVDKGAPTLTSQPKLDMAQRTIVDNAETEYRRRKLMHRKAKSSRSLEFDGSFAEEEDVSDDAGDLGVSGSVKLNSSMATSQHSGSGQMVRMKAVQPPTSPLESTQRRSTSTDSKAMIVPQGARMSSTSTGEFYWHSASDPDLVGSMENKMNRSGSTTSDRQFIWQQKQPVDMMADSKADPSSFINDDHVISADDVSNNNEGCNVM